VLVHGLALTPEAASILNQRGASLIICPTSNEFLFHRSPTYRFITSIDRVALGSDSPLTAAGDLLDEVRFVHDDIGIDAGSLYEMVTERSAKVLRLQQGEGHVRPGAVADLIAVRDEGLAPAETLARLTAERIELVIRSGRVQLASPSIYSRLESTQRTGLQLIEIDGYRRWVRAPIEDLLTEAAAVLGSDLRLGGKRIGHVSAA
jgi:cytosine/adenosine deaminase-related metal-dependent hydrolase